MELPDPILVERYWTRRRVRRAISTVLVLLIISWVGFTLLFHPLHSVSDASTRLSTWQMRHPYNATSHVRSQGLDCVANRSQDTMDKWIAPGFALLDEHEFDLGGPTNLSLWLDHIEAAHRNTIASVTQLHTDLIALVMDDFQALKTAHLFVRDGLEAHRFESAFGFIPVNYTLVWLYTACQLGCHGVEYVWASCGSTSFPSRYYSLCKSLRPYPPTPISPQHSTLRLATVIQSRLDAYDKFLSTHRQSFNKSSQETLKIGITSIRSSAFQQWVEGAINPVWCLRHHYRYVCRPWVTAKLKYDRGESKEPFYSMNRFIAGADESVTRLTYNINAMESLQIQIEIVRLNLQELVESLLEVSVDQALLLAAKEMAKPIRLSCYSQSFEAKKM